MENNLKICNKWTKW